MSAVFTRRALPWLILSVIVLRAAALIFDVLNIDETHFQVIARVIALGGMPFVDAVDIKPPLVYLAYLPSALFGFSMWPMRVLGVLWVLATAWALGRAAHAWTGRSEAGWAAAWLSVLAGLCEVPSVNTELLMNLPCALALERFIRAEKNGRSTDVVLAGALIGAGSLFRHQAAIMLVAIALGWLWQSRARGHQLAKHASLALGFALPWIATVLFFSAAGSLPAFFEWVIERNFLYVGARTELNLIRVLFAILLGVVLGAPLPWLLATRATFAVRRDAIGLTLALILWLTWIPVAMGGRFYAHYFLQFVPALSLLGASAAVAICDRWSTLAPRVRAGLVALAALPAAGYLAYTIGRGVTEHYPAQRQKPLEVAAWLRANTDPAERVFMWGDYTPIYYLAERLPGSRYASTAPLIGNFDPEHIPAGYDVSPHRSERDVRRALEDLERLKPALVLDTAAGDIHDWSKIPLERVPELDEYVKANYTLVATPAGARVYRRNHSSTRPMRSSSLDQ